MELKHCRIDPTSASPSEIKAEIDRLTKLKIVARNADKNLKVIANSVYGVVGYIKFIEYHKESALAITQQGLDVIKFTDEKIFNYYFHNLWPEDTELHQHMGIKPENVYQPLPDDDFVVYIDTDSNFVSLDKIYRHSGVTDEIDVVDFALKMWDFRMKDFISETLEKYCHDYNAYPVLFNGDVTFSLVLEEVCESVFWRAKKRYIKHVRWHKGLSYGHMEELESKGLEMRQSAYPAFIRTEILNILKHIINQKGKVTSYEISELCQEMRNKFEIAQIDHICKNERLSNYTKFIADDTTTIEVNSGANHVHKGSAYYNHLLKKRPDLQKRYRFIKNRDRVRFYYVKSPIGVVETFAFHSDEFPAEFAPQIDYDKMFENNFLNSINLYLEALGLAKLPTNLMVLPDDFF